MSDEERLLQKLQRLEALFTEHEVTDRIIGEALGSNTAEAAARPEEVPASLPAPK